MNREVPYLKSTEYVDHKKIPERDPYTYYSQYLPSLAQTNRPELAQSLISIIEEANIMMERILLTVAKEGITTGWGEVSDIIYRLNDLLKDEEVEYSITKEFFDQMKTFVSAVTQKANLTGQHEMVREKYAHLIQRWLQIKPIQEAEKISQRRTLLTHGARNAFIYKILEKGILASVSEQKRQFETYRRTFANDYRDSYGQEVHGIVFEEDKIYRNLSSGDRVLEEYQADIILVFNENDLLSRGLLYRRSDGEFLFDPNYKSGTPEKQGLSLNLKETPHMFVVTNKQKDKFIHFLITQSVWKNELQSLSREELEDWIQTNIFFVDDIHDFRCTQEIKEKFINEKHISQHTGFVELTNENEGGRRLKRFVYTTE